MRSVRVIANLEAGGAQLSALRLARALEPRGWRTRFLAGSASAEGIDLFRRRGVEVEVFRRSGNLQYACLPTFADWLEPRLAGADLVHGHMLGAWWAAARAAGRSLPVVGSEHNAYQWPPEPPFGAVRQALERVDLLFVHGPAAREQALRLGADPGLLREGRSAIDTDAAPVQPRLAPRRLVYVGRLHAEKGPDLLLRALALLVPRPTTYLVGSGPMEPELKALAGELGIERQVVFTGWQERPAEWLHGAAACVVPSRFDAWSQSAVLAMRLGVPVVGTAVDGLIEVLAGGRGLAVQPEEPAALASALSDVLAGRRSTDLDAARRYARSFAPANVAELYDGAYRHLLELRAAAAHA